MVKLLMNWDIRRGQEKAYFEFQVKEFLPALMKLGLRPQENWYTVYGHGPQILAGAVADDLETMQQILAGEEWQKLLNQLGAYVTNYRQRIVRNSRRFQI